jgi:hypothetical protein
MALNGTAIDVVPVNASDSVTWYRSLWAVINTYLPITYGPGVINQEALDLFPINGASWVYTNYLKVSLILQRGRVISVSSTATATLALRLAFLKTLSVLSTGVASISSIIAYLKTLSVSVSSFVSIVYINVYIVLLNVLVSVTASLEKSIGLTFSVISTATASITNFIQYLIYVSVTGAASIVRDISATLSVLSTAIASLVKIPNKLLSVASTATVSYIRAIDKILDIVSQYAVVVAIGTALHLIGFAINVTGAPVMIRNFWQSLSVMAYATVSLFKRSKHRYRKLYPRYRVNH